MSDLEKAIKRLNDAIDALEKRKAAKALIGMLANLNYNLPPQPSPEIIDGWSGEEIDGWWAELEPLLPPPPDEVG